MGHVKLFSGRRERDGRKEFSKWNLIFVGGLFILNFKEGGGGSWCDKV
jgi:hypothetical protein